LNMTKKKTALLALALIALVATVSATAFFIISNVIQRTANVSKANNILITVEGFPTEVKFGRDLTFTVTTESLADQELPDLVTWITIQYNDTEGNPVVLDPSYFYIYYNDTTTPWEGEIGQYFMWNSTFNALLFTGMGGGSWDAPVGYYNEATITCRIDAYAPLPDGTVTWKAWVEAPLAP